MSFDHDDIWINAPIWLRKAYLNDTVVNAAMKEAVMEGFNERDTLLLVINGLLFRDQLRLDQIGELQAKTPVFLTYFPPHRDILPSPSHVGRKFRFKGQTGVHTVLNEWVDGDDCSGTYGDLKYCYLEGDGYRWNTSYAASAKNCELLDE